MWTHGLERSEWKSYSERISRALTGKRAEVEVVGLDLGNQVRVGSPPLVGLAYDHEDGRFEIALEGLDRLAHRPREVHVTDGPDGLLSLAVVDPDGRRQIVRLKDPLALPSPNQA